MNTMKGKKILCLVICLSFILTSVLSVSVFASQKTTQKPVELVWYQIGTPQKDTDRVFEEVSKYTLSKINAKVKMIQFDWGDYNQRMQVIISSGETYDICFTCSWANDYKLNAQKGAFVELNGLLDKYGKDIKRVINPKFLEGAKINGKLYAIPVNKEVGAQPVWNVNVKIAQKYNIDYSKFKYVNDISLLEPYLKKVKQGEGNKFVPLNSDGTWLYNAIAPYDVITSKFGVYFDVNKNKYNYKVVNVIDTPQAKKFAQTMRKYYLAGYIRKDIVTRPDSSDLDKTGNWFLGAYHYMPLAEISDSANKGYKVDVAPITKPFTATWSTTGSMHAISVTSKNPEKAMMFLNLLNSDKKLRVMVGSGIENVHYKLVNGRQVTLDQGKNNYSVPQFAMGNVFLTNLLPEEPANKWSLFNKFNNESVPAPTLGFYPDLTPIANEIAAINNVINEFDRAVFNGAVDPNTYLPKYINKMKAAGADKVIKELQKQLDKWRSIKK